MIRRRRGSAYVVILAASMLVTVIGLSALLVARARTVSLEATRQLAQTRLDAQSALDLALAHVDDDPDWRSTLPDGTWIDLPAAGGLDVAFRLIDERDGMLFDDDRDPVRLFVRAARGPAIRRYSVVLDPIVGRVGNLLENPDAELGTAGWTAAGSATLAATTVTTRTPRAALHVVDRASPTAGLAQRLEGVLRAGRTYRMEAWMRMEPGQSDLAFLELNVVPLDGATSRAIGGLQVVDDDGWTRATATFTPAWTGDLAAATITVRTASTTAAFFVDDMTLIDMTADTDHALAPRPGTWRREVAPVDGA